jgi:hypothetical protein
VARYNLTNGQLVVRYSKKTEDLKSIQLSRDGKQLVLCTEKYFTVYNVEKGDSLKTMNHDTDAEMNQATFTADGKRVCWLVITMLFRSGISPKVRK